MRDLERRRAEDALAKVTVLASEPPDFQQSYRSYVDRFGGAVLMNGLGQALATELAAAEPAATAETRDGVDSGGQEDKRAHRKLAENVAGWLSGAGGVYSDAAGAMDVVKAIVEGDQAHYVRAQVETLAWLTWHKKFCHASFPRGGDL